MVLNNIEIKSYTIEDLQDFTDMFTTYFRDDFKIEISDVGAVKLCEKITNDVLSGVLNLDMLVVNGKKVGFMNTQIDSPKSDWCEREGWGFIREMYIHKAYRQHGLGIKFVNQVEETFFKKGVDKIYLTSDDTEKFWCACGYVASGVNSTINEDPIFEKTLSLNSF